jgi:PAS domain S-box-containing protein
MKNILLIDDDKETHILIRRLIERAGHRLISAYNGDAGLSLIKDHSPDLVILDFKMPEKDGWQTYSEFKENHSYHHLHATPVIMLTAIDQSAESLERILKSGITACLKKPFGNKELVNIIENALVSKSIAEERIRLTKLLERSRNFMHNLIESCPAAIFTVDENGLITFVSKAVERLIGYEASELIGKKFNDLVKLPKEDFRRLVEKTKESGAFVNEEVTAVSLSGGVVPIGLTFSVLEDNSRDVIGFLILGQDLSDRKKLERELVEKERLAAITESLATINHQINNPLTPILGNVQLILSEKKTLAQNHIHKLHIIETNARKISEIIKKFNQVTEPIRRKYYDNANMLDVG